MKLKGIAAHEEVVTKVTEKGATWLRSKYAEWWLAGIAFSESMFAPIIIDPFLIAMIFAHRKRWVRYTINAIVFSVLGGLAGYALGAVFFDTVGADLIRVSGLEERFDAAAENIDRNGFVFVLIGAFTPIPYKIVAIASGLLQVNIVTFLVASIFGRLFRLGLVGFAAYAVGPHALPVIQRNLHLLAAIVGLILIIYILVQVL